MLVGMYLRVTSRTNADGSVVRYVALAHNERVDGQTRARVLLNLGREDGLDTDGLRRLVSSISRFLGDADPYAAGSGERADLLRMTSSRSMGGAWLLDGLWKQLGIDAALRRGCQMCCGAPRGADCSNGGGRPSSPCRRSGGVKLAAA